MKIILTIITLIILSASAVFAGPIERKAEITAKIKALQAEKKLITRDARIQKAQERVAKAIEALNKAKTKQ